MAPTGNLITTLKEKEISDLCKTISYKTGLPYQSVVVGEAVHGIYRQQYAFASGGLCHARQRSQLPACAVGVGDAEKT
ncbi:DUF3363 domain-containing protein [Bartonella sp. W8122]|uniref:DUF3363 domain-containing protein n=1 Tax=Bartonella TaxID=773 RepID=UPI0018DE1B3A|nr:DUF3363 domain-containing protein [Bartonella sp. W8122]MBI0021416.1 DUF3363 domain-containing protein [Bartonella apihabitans]